MMTAILGLSSALVWGGGDFCGGVAAKRAPLPWVLAIGNIAGLSCLLLLAFITGEHFPDGRSLLWGVSAGVFGALGLSMLYRGLATGSAALVAPVSAVISAIVPVVAGSLLYGMPGHLKFAGFALALGGIWLVSKSDSVHGRKGLGCALLAGCGFGLFLVSISRAGAQGSVFFTLSAARITSLALYSAALLRTRPLRGVTPGLLALIILSGLFDTGGNALFALASRTGRLDFASVFSSLYPASTVLLFRFVLGEKLRINQIAGFIIILAAIVCIVK